MFEFLGFSSVPHKGVPPDATRPFGPRRVNCPEPRRDTVGAYSRLKTAEFTQKNIKLHYLRVFQKRTLRFNFAQQIRFLKWYTNFVLSLISINFWNQIFEKSLTNVFSLMISVKKNSEFWKQIFKNHVNMVILKMVLPHPQLYIKF